MVANLAQARSHTVAPDVFLRHFQTITECEQAHAQTGAACARAKKAAKTSGVDMGALALLKHLAKTNPAALEIRLAHTSLYADWADLPIGTQLNLLGKPDVPGPSEEARADHRNKEALAAGQAGAKTGSRRLDNPHAAGTSEYVHWDRGWTRGNRIWLKGQSAIAESLGDNAKRIAADVSAELAEADRAAAAGVPIDSGSGNGTSGEHAPEASSSDEDDAGPAPHALHPSGGRAGIRRGRKANGDAHPPS